MDIEDRKYSLVELERYSYRVLQQIAKSLCLPSNVKKIYLIQMIHTKKFKSEEELKEIIQKVKQERQQVSQGKKKAAHKQIYLQGPEISSTSNSLSPPISMTPKRTRHIVIRCSPENIRQAIAKYNARQNTMNRSATAIRKTYPSPKKSDRVLRSFNIKTSKNDTKFVENSANTSFKTVNLPNNTFGSVNNSVFSILKSHNVMKETQGQKFPKKITENCMVKKYTPVLSRLTFGLDPERSQLIPMTRNVGTNPMVPAKRQRVLSGIYPLISKEPPKICYEYVQSVGFRRRDGKISKINALVQKRTETPQTEVTVQDIINKSIAQTLSKPQYVNTETNTSLIYSNNSQECATVALKTERYDTNMDQRNKRYCDMDNTNEIYVSVDNRNERYGIVENRYERYGNPDQISLRYDGNIEGNEYQYYHKKIRGEQVRSQRSYQREVSRDVEERLPKINDVFSRFNALTDVTQPIYVQVSDEPERLQNQPPYQPTSSTHLLEQLYNFRSGFVVNQPLQQLASTARTSCVYSTPVIATAVAQPTTLVQDYNNTNLIDYSDLAGFPRICELLRFGEQDNLRRDFRCDEELSTSSSLDDSASQELGAAVTTIPEMVEDALELISQDGDYMERIGMDVRIQCVLCPFVCPKFLLEYHIRKEHANEIHHQEHNSWTMRFPLGGVAGPGRRVVLALDAALLVLAVRCRADCLHSAAYSLVTDTNLPKSGSITIYNKVTGEPYTWEGEIQTLPHDFANNNNTDGLKVEVSKLDLLPNSANLKLLNGELVLNSPTKVVVGQPDLNDIHVILFIKIFN